MNTDGTKAHRKAGVLLALAAGTGVLMAGTITAAFNAYKKPSADMQADVGKTRQQVTYDIAILGEAAFGSVCALAALQMLHKKP